MERSFRGSVERGSGGGRWIGMRWGRFWGGEGGLPGRGGARLGRVELDRDQVGEILEFVRVLDASGVRLDSVDEAGPEGIEATVEGRMVVFSGGVGEGQAKALTDIMRRHPEAETFDLRSPDRKS